MNPALSALQQEASRRGMGMPASNVGMRANPSASQPATQPPANPLASRQGMGTQQPATPSAANPNAGALQMMNGAQPGGSTILEKGLLKRLMMYPAA